MPGPDAPGRLRPAGSGLAAQGHQSHRRGQVDGWWHLVGAQQVQLRMSYLPSPVPPHTRGPHVRSRSGAESGVTVRISPALQRTAAL